MEKEEVERQLRIMLKRGYSGEAITKWIKDCNIDTNVSEKLITKLKARGISLDIKKESDDEGHKPGSV